MRFEKRRLIRYERIGHAVRLIEPVAGKGVDLVPKSKKMFSQGVNSTSEYNYSLFAPGAYFLQPV